MRTRTALASLALAVMLPTGALATNISAASEGFVASALLSVDGSTIVDVPPVASSSGTAPGPYSDASGPVSFSDTQVLPIVGGDLIFDFELDVLASTADSDVDGAAGSRTTDASATGATGSFSITFDAAFGPDVPLVAITLDALTADASVSGDFGALVASGSSSIGSGTVNGTPFAANPLPNTVVLDLLGVKLTLNEQIEVCGPSDCSLEVNALHLEIDAVFIGKDIVGDVILAHADASQIAVPEGSALVLLGAAGLALALRRRRLR